MPAKFQLKKGTTGKFRFVLLATNGQVVATSEAYERKASALAGIRSVQKIVSTAAVEDTTTVEFAEAEATKKAAKKSGAKKAAPKAATKAAKAAKKVVTKAAAAPPAAARKAAPRKAAAAKTTGRRPVRQAPPPLTTPPQNLVPKL